jgi:predicted nucleic acid-binding protein
MDLNQKNSVPFKRPIVVLDANILFPVPLCDLFMHLAIVSVIRVHWSERIEAEWVRNIIGKRPNLDPSRVRHRASRMNAAMPDAMVSGSEHLEMPLLESGIKLPDPDDLHVVATAIHASADAIITKNLTDFPSEILTRFDLKALHPDLFVQHLLESNPDAVIQAVRNQQEGLFKPAQTMSQVLETLTNQGMILTSAPLRILLKVNSG